MQLRDQKSAGAALLALRRELSEELGFEASSFNRFVCSEFDLSSMGAGEVYRAVHEVPVYQSGELRVTPYDAFAVWFHHARRRLEGTKEKVN